MLQAVAHLKELLHTAISTPYVSKNWNRVAALGQRHLRLIHIKYVFGEIPDVPTVRHEMDSSGK
jgi:hypothetical protein